MSKALIYTVNSGTQAVAAGGTISLGSINRRYGNTCCNNPIINLNGDGITLAEEGYYKVAVDVTAAPTAAGPVTITLFQDGVALPGGVKTGTAAAAGDAVALSLSAPVARVRCGASSSLTVQLTAGAGNVTNIAVSVVKE